MSWAADGDGDGDGDGGAAGVVSAGAWVGVADLEGVLCLCPGWMCCVCVQVRRAVFVFRQGVLCLYPGKVCCVCVLVCLYPGKVCCVCVQAYYAVFVSSCDCVKMPVCLTSHHAQRGAPVHPSPAASSARKVLD